MMLIFLDAAAAESAERVCRHHFSRCCLYNSAILIQDAPPPTVYVTLGLVGRGLRAADRNRGA